MKFAAAVCAATLIVFGGATIFLRSTIAQPRDEAASSAADARAADLAILEEQFLNVDRSYSADQRRRAQEKLADLRLAAPRLSAAQFELGVAEIGALANNGHTGIRRWGWNERFNRVPVAFIMFDDGLRVGSSDAHPELKGLEVVAIDGKNLDALRLAWSRYWPGRSRWRDQQMYQFIESPELLHAAGVAASPERFALTLRTSDGAELTRTLTAATGDGDWHATPREFSMLPTVASPSDRPLYLRNLDETPWYFDLHELDAVYVRFLRNFDPVDPKRMRAAADAIAVRLEARRPKYAIVDQRFNGGGDLTRTRDLMQRIPGALKPDGHVFVITSAHTFSAAISSIGYLKQAGGSRVTIVGSPVGDELEFWAEGGPVRLPNTGIVLAVSRERHNYRTGCPEPDCHSYMRRNPIAVETLEPDVTPAFTYADFQAGRDPYMEAVVSAIRRRP